MSLRLYSWLRMFLRLVVRVFFRQVEVVGLEHVPERGPVIFAGNHPNSLIDPLLIVVSCGRVVRFAAKDVLFRSPFLRPVLRALGAVPIARRSDHADARRGGRAQRGGVRYADRGAGRRRHHRHLPRGAVARRSPAGAAQDRRGAHRGRRLPAPRGASGGDRAVRADVHAATAFSQPGAAAVRRADPGRRGTRGRRGRGRRRHRGAGSRAARADRQRRGLGHPARARRFPPPLPAAADLDPRSRRARAPLQRRVSARARRAAGPGAVRPGRGLPGSARRGWRQRSRSAARRSRAATRWRASRGTCC